MNINILNVIRNYLSGNDSRTNRMRKNSLTMIIVKGISLSISLLYVPMLLHAVDKVEYGILLTLTSMVQWVGMLDIGLGNGLRNSLPICIADRNFEKAKQLISSCYAALSFYVIVCISVFFIADNWISWKGVLNAPQIDEYVLRNLAIVVFLSFCCQFVLNLINAILFAFQLPAYTSIINLTTQIITFICVFILINIFNVHSMFVIGSFTCMLPPLIILVGTYFIFDSKLREVKPSIRLVNFKSVNGILSVGLRFFFLQIITIILFQANSIILSQSVGPESVVEYNIVYKYIGLISIVFYIVISPVWSAVTEAYYKNDFKWIVRTERHLLKQFFGMLILGFILVLMSKFVYKIWLGDGIIEIPYKVTLLTLIFISFEMLYKIYGSILNGMGKLNLQMIITSIIAIVYIPLALKLGETYGISGVLFANISVFCINFIWSKMQYGMIINKTARGIWNR